MDYPRIIAHRGGGALAPENTLAGLRLAARLGCRGVEFDAMLSADGVPVLIHDESLERTTSGSGSVAAIDAAGFGALDAGARHHPAFAGEPAPTLDQALQLCAALGLWANVEIKPSAGRETETGRIVARHAAAAAGRIVLSSFSPPALAAAAAAAAHLPRAVLFESLAADWRRRMTESGALAVHVAASALTGATLEELRAAGVPLACYTVNRRDEAQQLFAQGVDAVFTDRPELWLPPEM